MGKYILRRLLQLVPLLIGLSLVVFLMLRLVPGDPVEIMLGGKGTAETRARMRAALGLDKPVHEQYLLFLARMARGDIGESFVYHRPAMPLILQRFPRTLFLCFYSLVLSVVIAFPMGTLAALKKGSVVDSLIRAFATLTLCLPSFWVGLLLIIAFSVRLHLLPVGGFGRNLYENLVFLFLPALSMALGGSGVLIRNLRVATLEVLQSDHVRTARAKGLPRRLVLLRHVLRNSLISTVTLLGLRIAYGVGGAVLVETVFVIPGLGSLMLDSIMARDYPVVQAITLMLAFVVTLANLATDLTYAVVDPRIRYA